MRTWRLLVFFTFCIVVDVTRAAGDGTLPCRDGAWSEIAACFADAQASDDPGIVEGAELQCEAMLRAVTQACDDGTAHSEAVPLNLVKRSHDD